METNVNYTLAGIFVIALLSFMIYGVIWLSAGISSDTYTYYQVNMKESVTGLTTDSPVKFNGVDVGTVDSMIIDKDNPQLVVLYLKVKHDTPVTVATRAQLGMNALTGVAYIILIDKGTNKRPLVARNDQAYPVINTTPSIIVKLDLTLNQINESFRDVSNSIKALLSPENIALFHRFLVNVIKKTS